jgi:hypothetical protein
MELARKRLHGEDTQIRRHSPPRSWFSPWSSPRVPQKGRGGEKSKKTSEIKKAR